MVVEKCPYCQGKALLQIHAPHIPHAVVHTIGHHSKEVGKLALSNPFTAAIGLLLGGIALAANALSEGEYRCKRCKREFKA